MRICTFTDAGSEACKPRHQRLDTVDDRDDIGTGLSLYVDDHSRRQIHPRRSLDVLGIVNRVRDVGKFDRCAVVVRDNQRQVILGREQLVVGANRVRLLPAVEVPFRLVDVGAGDCSAQILERDSIRRERSRIGLDPYRRFLAAADTHQSNAGELRDLLRQPRVREIFHLVQRQFLRRQRERENRGVGRIGLAVNGRIREIRRQVGRSRIYRRLHFLLGNVDVQIEIELERDNRGAERAVRGHLREPGHLPELALERSSYRRRHHVRTRARVERHHLDRRIVHLRQRRDGELPISDQPRKHQADHQQRSRDRPQYERARKIQGVVLPGGRAAVCTLTCAPCCSLSTPSVTTTSPTARPLLIAITSPCVAPTVTGRISTV